MSGGPSPFHRFALPLAEPSHHPFHVISAASVVRIMLQREPRFLRWKSLYRNARKQWINEKHNRLQPCATPRSNMASNEMQTHQSDEEDTRCSEDSCMSESSFQDADDTVALSDDFDSCQRPTYSSDSDVNCEVIELSSDAPCDESTQLSNEKQFVSKRDYNQFLPCGYSSIIDFNPFGLIAGVIARDTQGGWHRTHRYSVNEILELLEYDSVTCWNVSTSPSVNATLEQDSEHVQLQRLDEARTCRILVRLHERSIRLHDLACWLPPVDQTGTLVSSLSQLGVARTCRQLSQRRARRFFRALPSIHRSEVVHVFHVNIEPNAEHWKGAYRLIMKDSGDNCIKWHMDLSDSFRSSAKASEEHDVHWHHPLASFLYGWQSCREWYMNNDARLREQYRIQAIGFVRKIRRLHVGPKPNSFADTVDWLETTQSLNGCVRKNEWTTTLFHWLSLPSEEIDKERHRNRNTHCPSAQIRAMCILSLLFLDLRTIKSLANRANVHRHTFTYTLAGQLSDAQAQACSERNRIWFGTLPLFLHAGVPLHSLRVRIPISATDMACRFLYNPTSLRKANKHASDESTRQALELVVREWCNIHAPHRQVEFHVISFSELERLSPFENIQGLNTQDYINVMKMDVVARARHELSRPSAASKNKEPFLEHTTVLSQEMSLFTHVRLHHYRPVHQARTFCYYNLCVWPPIANMVNSTPMVNTLELIASVEKEQWNAVQDLHPFALDRPEWIYENKYDTASRSQHFGILYWNQLAKVGLRWLAMDAAEFQNQVSSDTLTCAIYRQVIIHALSLLND